MWARIAIGVLAVVFFAALESVSVAAPSVVLPLWPLFDFHSIPLWALPVGGLLAGLALGAPAGLLQASGTIVPQASAVLLLAALAFSQLAKVEFLVAAIAVSLTAALVAVVALLKDLLRQGETIELESHWGGLGGGLGGWRLSRTASVCVLAIVLAISVVAVIQSGSPQAPSAAPATPVLPH